MPAPCLSGHDAAFPLQMDTVDFAAGNRLLNGKTGAYLSLLERYAPRLRQTADSLTELLTSRGRSEEAARIAHGIRGEAAGLAVFRVAELAEELERGLQQDIRPTATQMRTFLLAVRAFTDEISAKITPLLTEPPPAQTTQSGERALLQDIHRLLLQNDYCAANACRAATERLRQYYGVDFVAMMNAAEHFRFEEALKIAGRLLDSRP